MQLVYYPIILVVGTITFYILAGKNKTKENAAKIEESELKPGTLPSTSSFKFSVFVKSNGKICSSYEGDNICDLGYLIYTKLIKPDYRHEIYISNNQTNELMRIDKNDDSECMIGVNHPEHGHFGYLPFTYVASFAE